MAAQPPATSTVEKSTSQTLSGAACNADARVRMHKSMSLKQVLQQQQGACTWLQHLHAPVCRWSPINPGSLSGGHSVL